MDIEERQLGQVTILNLHGKLVLGEPTSRLRDRLVHLIEEGRKNILLNLSELEYMDSAGLGVLTSSFATVNKAGGAMKLVAVQGRVMDLMQLTKLITVFDVFENESLAVVSFG